MWVPHKELKKKNIKVKGNGREFVLTVHEAQRHLFLVFFLFYSSFSDSRVSVRQNSSG